MGIRLFAVKILQDTHLEYQAGLCGICNKFIMAGFMNSSPIIAVWQDPFACE
jgi:hypothetical protein